MKTLEDLLIYTVQQKGSDLHIATGAHAFVRIDGDMEPCSENILTTQDTESMFDEVLTEKQKKDLYENLESDFSFESQAAGSRFRANMFFQAEGVAGVFRVIPKIVPSLEELGAPEIFTDLANLENGIVLVTGPTGSGKSTTLAAIIHYINHHHKKHILTIEDPIEYYHQGQQCLINQREVHKNTLSFNNALKSALREDPDVILVGELRDLETIRLALTAAETGHLVFGTLHTSSAPKTINRIIDVFPGDEKPMVRAMLSESLQSVIAQTLLKRIGGGRCAAHEIMIVNSAIRNMIREGKISQMVSAIQTGASIGMTTMQNSVQKLILSNQIDPKSAEHLIDNTQMGQ